MGAIGLGLLKTASNRQIAQQQSAKVIEIPVDSQAMTGLAAHVDRFWQAAWQAKLPIERTILSNLRQRTGVYEPGDLTAIRQQGGSEIFMMLTSGKCRGVESWLREILCSETDRPWGLSATPIPDLPPGVSQAIVSEVFQMAMAAGWEIDDRRIDDRLLKLKALCTQRIKELGEKIAKRHEEKIADQFAEGGWEDAISDCIYDLVTFPACIMRGPSLRMKKQRSWIAGPGGQWFPNVVRKPRYEYDRRSPLDIYPAPAMRNIQRGNLIDRYRFTREDFHELIGLPGYSEEKIKVILEQYGDRGYNSHPMNETQRAILELRRNEEYDPEGTIEVLDFWGTVSGHMLMDWAYKTGVDVGNQVKPHHEYQCEVLKTAGEVFKATLNPHALGEKPYDIASFEEIPGAFWGKGVPELMRDCQAMCNGAARAISNNAAIASGPMVEMQVDRFADGQKVEQPHPWQLFQTISDRQGANRAAINFFQPQMNVAELLAIYNHFSREGDNVTGFPAYATGDSHVGGAARTSSGLAQLMGNLGKGVRRVVSTVDRRIVKRKVAATYDCNMEHDPDPTIKGDLRAVPKGTAAVLIQATDQQRRMEMLQATANPIDASIIGIPGRAEMLRAALTGAHFDATKIIPDSLDLELIKSMLPPPHELLGKTGPNAPAQPGMGAGGGTPEAPANTDLAGNKPNGVQARQDNLGMADGGVVPRRNYRLTKSLDVDGSPMIGVERVEDDDA